MSEGKGLTPDQKKALVIAGGVAVLAILIYLLTRGNVIPIPAGATSIQGSPDYENNPPGYTSYNVPPLALPPSINPQPRTEIPTGIGCCCEENVGCFTSSPIDTGRGPISLEQLLNQYAESDKGFFDVLKKVQQPFEYPPATIIEQTNPQNNRPLNPYWNLALSSTERQLQGDWLAGPHYETIPGAIPAYAR